MLAGPVQTPAYQIVIEKSTWIRADRGGFMKFHVKPGDIVEKDQPLATNTTLLGEERSVLRAPFDAVVIGMTSLPAISPGEPICNLGKLPAGIEPAELRRLRAEKDDLGQRLSEEIGANVLLVESPTEASE